MVLPRTRIIYGFLCCCLLLLCQAAPTFAVVGETQRVVLQLRWDNQFQFAGYYEAVWQGYYEQAGLQVEIRPAIEPDKTILSAVEEVAAGRADFGIGAGDILVAIDEGAPLVILASILQQSAVGFYSLKGVPLEFPSDLMDLRVARIKNDLPDVEFQAMLRQEGLNPERIDYVQHKPGLETLLNGMADVIPGYRLTAPYLAKASGIELNAIYPFGYGINFYGDSLFCSSDLLESDRKLVEKFVQASLKGWEYALKHPEHTARRIATRLERQSPMDNPLAFNLFQAREIQGLTHYPYIPLGHMNPLRWERMHEYLQNSGLVHNSFNMDAIYDPKFRAAERRQRWLLIIGSLSVAGVLFTAMLLLWIKTLRRTVRSRTRELELSREHYRTVADFTYDWEYWLSPDNKLLYVSPSCERISGYKAREFLNDPELMVRIVIPEDRDAFRTHLDERHYGIAPRYMEFRITHKSGRTCWIGHACQQIFSISGEWLGERGSNRDITHAKELAARREEVERILRHDLRSPLLAVFAGLKMLEHESLDPEDKEEMIRELKQSAKDLIDMMDSLHSMSRMESKTYVLRQEQMDLYEMLQSAAGDVLHGECIVIKPLPEGMDEAPFVGDRGLCRSMLTNLLRNAVEAHADQPVTARLESDNDNYVISIHNAQPVPEEMRSCFFDKFATSGKSQGTGLGTYSAQLAASMHGGGITLETSQELGTKVVVHLPRETAGPEA